MGKEVQNCWPVFREDVWDKLWVVLTDGSNHSDTLMAFLPAPLDKRIELLQQGFIEFGRRREVIVVEGSGVELVLRVLHRSNVQFNLNSK